MRPYLDSTSDHAEIEGIRASMLRETYIHRELYHRALGDRRALEMKLATIYPAEICNYYLTSPELRQCIKPNMDTQRDMSAADIQSISATKANETQILQLLETRLQNTIQSFGLQVNSAEEERAPTDPTHITGRQLITQFMGQLYKESALQMAQALTSPSTIGR
jgi:hypothetical protein